MIGFRLPLPVTRAVIDLVQQDKKMTPCNQQQIAVARRALYAGHAVQRTDVWNGLRAIERREDPFAIETELKAMALSEAEMAIGKFLRACEQSLQSSATEIASRKRVWALRKCAGRWQCRAGQATKMIRMTTRLIMKT